MTETPITAETASNSDSFFHVNRNIGADDDISVPNAGALPFSFKEWDPPEIPPYSLGRPLSWFWSHDLSEPFANKLKSMGFTPVRLIRYRQRHSERRAALYHKRVPPFNRADWIQLIPQALELTNQHASLQAESVQREQTGTKLRVSVLGNACAGASTRVHLGLDRSAVQQLRQSGLSIIELQPYLVDREHYFVAISDAVGPMTHVLTGATSEELKFWTKQRKLVLSRLRRYVVNGEARFAAVAFRDAGRAWSWCVDVDTAGLTARINDQGRYLVDLDAYLNEDGNLRFAAVMYDWRN